MKKISAAACAVTSALFLVGCGTPASSLASPSTVATVSSTPSASPAPLGAITGQLGYPSEFIPPVTVYAVNAADPRIFFSVDTLRYPPAVIAPGPQAMYTITGIVPGTYNVFAYRNDDVTNDRGGPAVYSQFFLRCIKPSLLGATVPGDCNSQTGDHSLVPVTVGPAATVSGIDIKDWTTAGMTYPPRP